MAWEDKLDFVYRELKAQKRTRIFNLCLKITMLWFVIFLYFTYIHWMTKEEITKEASKILWEMIRPIATDMATDIINNNGLTGSWWIMDTINKK